ncbi:MAG: winged helix-turn-helix transcriptional regulator [Xanthomonadaceae bacterium]|nr:winged helix-turn-helix transcriptional regulator [Xanthomonadaceae bacterium]
MSRKRPSGHAELDLEHFLPYRLSVLSNRISGAIAREYSERLSLSVTEWRVMAVLGRYPGLSAREVAERTAMDKVAVSRAVASLLSSGRLEREFDDEDRRRSVLQLSAQGLAVYDQVVPLALGFEQHVLEGMPEAERALLFRLLDRLDEMELRAESGAGAIAQAGQ